MTKPPLTTRRLLGLDRSGPPPERTLRGQPLNPWTIPNAIGFVRIALIPVFVAFAFASGDGRSTTAAVIYAVIGGTDYLDGMLARITGQYSRLGALLDPLTDRLLVITGVVVCWRFDLLPRWALAVLVVREAFMIVLAELALRRGADIDVKTLGRWAVWPTMFSIFLAMLSDTWLGPALLYLGLALTLVVTVAYVQDAVRATKASTSP